MISVVTVPHTGTIYTLDLLRDWGVEIERKHLENTDAPPYGGERFGPGFPCPSSDEWRAYPDTHRVVCTLRDPMLAVISAINRGVPDRMISVDGWAVMAEWWERKIASVHFFPIPPTSRGFLDLFNFLGLHKDGYLPPATEARNTSEDRTGLLFAYRTLGCDVPGNPTFRRALDQLQETPAVEALFADHGFELPWFRGGL